ncbi:MAG: FAD-binding protein [Acidimicrobiia bacterium]|nr:FAD-binding protein [Acidimicrobiia bacterium]
MVPSADATADAPAPARPLRVAALVKQIPRFEVMELGPDGRLRREGLELEMNPYCRRAVAEGVELARATGGTCTVLTLGPPSAEDVLREAVAWGADAGVLVTDPAFAGSDTLATARALAAALRREGPFDLVLVGRNSVDADTGQVGPEVAELLDLPFATAVRELELRGGTVAVRCEHDDGWVEAEVDLPAVLSTAERLCDPCKVPPEGRASVPAERLRRLAAADLGEGPWGQEGSPTWVGPVRVHEVERLRHRLDADVESQVRAAVGVLVERGALDPALDHLADVGEVPAPTGGHGPAVGVVVEPDRAHLTRELLGAAAGLAAELGGRVVATAVGAADPAELGSWGADQVVLLEIVGAVVEEDVARGIGDWAGRATPWAILAPSTAWGREVAGRVAARLGAGLTGDAVSLETSDGRLVAWKPAFGGQLVAAVTATSPVQTATVRAGVLPRRRPRAAVAPVTRERVEQRGRVRVASRVRDDDLDVLAEAPVVVAVGQAVGPDEYGALQPLLDVLGAELGATRKVTDRGWQPRARQIGITGRSIAPGCSSRSAPAASSTTRSVSSPRAPCWRSTRIPPRRSSRSPTPGSSVTGARSSPCSSTRSPGSGRTRSGPEASEA